MKKGSKRLILLALVGALVFAFGGAVLADTVDLGPGMGTADTATGGGLEAAAVGELGDTTTTPPFEKVLDLPALNVDRDAEGRIVMDLPGLKLVGPAHPKAVLPDAPGGHGPSRLPVTGVNVGDILALGMAAVAGGGVALRRLRLSFAR